MNTNIKKRYVFNYTIAEDLELPDVTSTVFNFKCDAVNKMRESFGFVCQNVSKGMWYARLDSEKHSAIIVADDKTFLFSVTDVEVDVNDD